MHCITTLGYNPPSIYLEVSLDTINELLSVKCV